VDESEWASQGGVWRGPYSRGKKQEKKADPRAGRVSIPGPHDECPDDQKKTKRSSQENPPRGRTRGADSLEKEKKNRKRTPKKKKKKNPPIEPPTMV